MRTLGVTSGAEDTEKRRIGTPEVDEEYRQLDRFLVQRSRIVMLEDRYTYSGGYGIVRRAELYQSAYLPSWLSTHQYGPPQLVAVKQIKISEADNMLSVKRAFAKEILVWSSLGSHPGIAKFLGFYADFKRPEAWLISPWEANGSISVFIQAHDLEVPEKLSLVHDTIDALAFLHQLDPPICHGDIKSSNVLVSALFKAVLCDFGLARIHENSGFRRLETSTSFKGSIRWCSPEILDGEPRGPRSDVYAWAWLVWEIMTGKLPYENTSADFVVIRQIFESPLPQVDGESRLSDCLRVWELMKRCWNVDPLQRPTATMCKTTVVYLPRCTPTPENSNCRTGSAALLENLGDLESWKGNHNKSFAYLDEALSLYQEEQDIAGMASVLRKQAAAAYRNTELGKVRATANEAITHFKHLDDALGVADASFWLGCSLFLQERDAEALSILSESLAVYRAHGNDVGAANCPERIGQIQRLASQEERSLSSLEEALAIASRSGDRLGVARALRGIGYTHFDLSDVAKAIDALSEASAIAKSIGWEDGLSDILRLMGSMKMKTGDHHEAEELFRGSISAARKGRARCELAVALEESGKYFQSQLKFDESATLLEESCLLYRAIETGRSCTGAIEKQPGRVG